MKFSIYTYFFTGIAVPLLFFFAFIALMVAAIKFINKKRTTLIGMFAPLMCAIAICLAAIFCLSDGYQYPLSAVFMYNGDRYITAGYIESITDAPAPPTYYNSGSKKWETGKFLTVSGEKYYMPFGNVEVGNGIELYCNEGRVVYKYCLKDSLTEDEIGTRPVLTEDVTTSKQQSEKVWQKVAVISFLTLIIQVFLLYDKGSALLAYLIKKDKKTTQKIIPNKTGICIFGVMLIPLLGVTVGMVASGFKGVVLIVVPFLCVSAALAIKDLNTSLFINESSITIKVFNSIKTVSREEIVSVKLGPSRFPNNRGLVITLKNGKKLFFDQLGFWGLDNAYLILSRNT